MPHQRELKYSLSLSSSVDLFLRSSVDDATEIAGNAIVWPQANTTTIAGSVVRLLLLRCSLLFALFHLRSAHNLCMHQTNCWHWILSISCLRYIHYCCCCYSFSSSSFRSLSLIRRWFPLRTCTTQTDRRAWNKKQPISDGMCTHTLHSQTSLPLPSSLCHRQHAKLASTLEFSSALDVNSAGCEFVSPFGASVDKKREKKRTQFLTLTYLRNSSV